MTHEPSAALCQFVEQVAELRRAQQRAAVLGRTRDTDTHRRKCYGCGETSTHTSRITPGVNCPHCGSQDTRAGKGQKIGDLSAAARQAEELAAGLELRVDAAVANFEADCQGDGDSGAGATVHVFADGVCDGCGAENRPVKVCNGAPAAGICLCQTCLEIGDEYRAQLNGAARP